MRSEESDAGPAFDEETRPEPSLTRTQATRYSVLRAGERAGEYHEVASVRMNGYNSDSWLVEAAIGWNGPSRPWNVEGEQRALELARRLGELVAEGEKQAARLEEEALARARAIAAEVGATGGLG